MRTYPRLRLWCAALVFAVAPAALAAQADEAPLKVGVIDLDAAAFGSPAGQELAQQLTDFQQQLATELEARQEAVRAIEQRIAEADSLTVDERRVLEREYQDALTDFQRYQQDKQEEATALQNEGRDRIRAELAPVIEAVQEELGYDLILNGTSPIIILFSERVDITQLIIDRLAADPGGA